MRLDVYFSPDEIAPKEIDGRIVAVIDVLRASSTIAAALENGAKTVIPFASSEEVVLRSKSFGKGEVLLAGERKLFAISGFDLGNSPLEVTREAVEGKTILLTTTNGTQAMLAAQGARDVMIASYVNFSAVLAMLRAAARGRADIAIVCAGRERHFSLEDAACAGRYVRGIARRLSRIELNDAARTALLLHRRYGDDIPRLFTEASHGRALAEAGFHDDLTFCAKIDSHPVVPVFHDRKITKLGLERSR